MRAAMNAWGRTGWATRARGSALMERKRAAMLVASVMKDERDEKADRDWIGKREAG